MESGFGSASLPDSAAVLPTPPPENMMLDFSVLETPNLDQGIGSSGMLGRGSPPVTETKIQNLLRESLLRYIRLRQTLMTALYNCQMMGLGQTRMTAPDNSQMMGLGQTPMTASDMWLDQILMNDPDNSQMMGLGQTPMTAPDNSLMMILGLTPRTDPYNCQMMGLGQTRMTAPDNSQMMGLGQTPITAPDNSQMMGLGQTPMTAPYNSQMMGLGRTLNSMGNYHITSNHGFCPMTYVPDHSLTMGLAPDLTEWNPSVAATAEASCSWTMEIPKEWVKVEHDGLIYKFQVPPILTLEGVKEEVFKRIHNLQADGLKFMYKDRDGEMVTIACDEDLKDCYNYFNSSFNKTSVRLTLVANALNNP